MRNGNSAEKLEFLVRLLEFDSFVICPHFLGGDELCLVIEPQKKVPIDIVLARLRLS
jgi:hypothetical protein